jgi:hypothetical protein
MVVIHDAVAVDNGPLISLLLVKGALDDNPLWNTPSLQVSPQWQSSLQLRFIVDYVIALWGASKGIDNDPRRH